MSSTIDPPRYAANFTDARPEKTTQAFLDQLNAGDGPPMETMQPADARGVLEGAQKSVEVDLAPADVSQKTIQVDGMTIGLTIVRPPGATGTLPGFMFFHGGGWVLGDYPTHERLIRDLVKYSGAVAIYVDYSRSPEAQYPTAHNEAYAATCWVAEHGAEIGVDGSNLAVVGNSVGGNMAATVALRAVNESGPKLACEVLFWPVTDAYFETPSYNTYEQGHFLTRPMMKWFWDSYTKSESQRAEIYASPLRATKDQLAKLPPTLVQTAELDVLRDEGEAYARKMDDAGVAVTWIRINGMIHDYGLLNPLAKAPAVQAALSQAGETLKSHLFA